MIKKIVAAFRPALMCLFVVTILCGFIYPAFVTGIAQIAFPNQANGSIITITKENGTQTDVGSVLIGQEFTKPEYLIGRPMGTSNLSPVSEEQHQLVSQRIAWWQSLDPENKALIPMDLVTASGSGVDPNISPEAAEYQVTRISRERNISEELVRKIINQNTTEKLLGFWGEPSVNVLKVNLALDGLIQ